MLLCTALTPDGIMYFSAVTPDGYYVLLSYDNNNNILFYVLFLQTGAHSPNTKQTITVTPDGTRASEHLMVLCASQL